MRTEKIAALVQEASEVIDRVTDLVDYIEFRDDGSLYMYCRMLRRGPPAPGYNSYEIVTLTSPDSSLTLEEKRAIYEAVYRYIQIDRR